MNEDENVLADSLSGDSEDVENGGVGVGDAESNSSQNDESGQGIANEDDPYSVKKRLGQQAKKHAREMRQLQDQISQMHAHIRSNSDPDSTRVQNSEHYNSPGQPSPIGMSEEDKIRKAVSYALGAKEHEERQAKEAQRQAHVTKQYQRLNNEFDRASDKYDDFDDVVRSEDVPFTAHVRDALLLVENPAEVAYRLGKNRSELERISQLHPLDQAREVNKLSFSIMNGAQKQGTSSKSNPMGDVKSNPTRGSVNGRASPSEIRARMKAGTWK